MSDAVPRAAVPGRLFLSYARGDDEPFVARLYQHLRDLGFGVWWDREDMPNRGLTFLREIRDAIAASDRLVLVCGPGALGSDYVRAEWQYALGICKPVMTLLRLGSYEQLPAALGADDVLDCRDDRELAGRLRTFERQLRGATAPAGKLVGVPELPARYLPRLEDVAALRAALLRDGLEPVVLTAPGRRAGMQGMGGIGKTVLAAAVARECGVRRGFPDGVLWITLGQRPNLTARQAALCQALGDPPQIFADVEAGRTRLAGLLAERACLVVLDDLWARDHAAAFEALGPRSSLVVTTRDERLLDDLGAVKHRVGVLSEEAALELMARALLAPAATADEAAEPLLLARVAAGWPADARLVAGECGYLPLALALCAAQVRDGIAWPSLLEALREADLQYLDHPQGSVFKSIKVSLDALEHEDAGQARRYLELAVFSPDLPVPEAAVRLLWRQTGALEARAAEKLLVTLDRKALIRLEGTAPSRSMRLHDLQHDFVRGELSDAARVHGALVEAYQSKCGGSWSQGPNDGYFFERLAYHLLAAGRADELRGLLTGSPAWMEAQFAAGRGDSAFVNDLELAMGASSAGQPLALIQLLAARRVVDGRVRFYSDADLETLVRLGRHPEALSHAALRTDGPQRLAGLLVVYETLRACGRDDADLLDEAVALGADLDLSVFTAHGPATRLAAALFQADRPSEAMSLVRRADLGAPSTYSRSRLVESLERRGRLAEAAAVVRTIDEPRPRAAELAAVGRAALQAGQRELACDLYRDAMAEGRPPEGEAVPEDETGHFARLLGSMAASLGADPRARPFWSEALAAAARITGDGGYVLGELTRELTASGPLDLAPEAASMVSDYQRSAALGAVIAAATRAGDFDIARAAAIRLEDPARRAQALTDVAAALHGTDPARAAAVFTEALETARATDPASNDGRLGAHGDVRTQTLCRLAVAMARAGDARAAELLEPIVAEARADSVPAEGRAEHRAFVGRAVMDAGDAALGRTLFAEAIELAADGQGGLFNLVCLLAEAGAVDEALAAADRMTERRDDALEWAAEAAARAGSSDAACALARAVSDVGQGRLVLAKLAEILAPLSGDRARALFEEALAARSWRLGSVISHLVRSPACWTPELIERALGLVGSIEDRHKRAGHLKGLLPVLVERRWTPTVAALMGVMREQGLAAGLADDLRQGIERAIGLGQADLAVMLAQALPDPAERSRCLLQIASGLAASDATSAGVAARMAVGDDRVRALEEVARGLARQGDPRAAAVLDEKLAAGRSDDTADTVAALGAMARSLARHGHWPGAVAALRAVPGDADRAGLLASVAGAFVDAGRLESLLPLARAIEPAFIRARAVLALADAGDEAGLFTESLACAEPEGGGAAAGCARADCHEWIAALCDAAVRRAASDEPRARMLFAAARRAPALAGPARPPGRVYDPRRSVDPPLTSLQAQSADGLARAGWFTEAVDAALAVEDGEMNDAGTTRAFALAAVAESLARAGHAARAREVAAQADGISVQATLAVVSVAPMALPEGFDSHYRSRTEEVIAEVERQSGPTDPGASAPATDWRRALETRGLEAFLGRLAAVADDLDEVAAGLGLAALREATRIAGWISPLWAEVWRAMA